MSNNCIHLSTHILIEDYSILCDSFINQKHIKILLLLYINICHFLLTSIIIILGYSILWELDIMNLKWTLQNSKIGVSLIK